MAKTMNDFRGIHSGRIGIVAGAGPSLRHLSPEMAEPHVMIAVNGAIIKFPKAPYFLCCDPASRLYRSWQVARESDCEIILARPVGLGFGDYDSKIGDRYDDGIEDRVTILERKPDGNDVRFNSSDQQLIYGMSSAHCALHFAVLLGCKPIVLIGCDCGCEDGVRDYGQHEDQICYKNTVGEERFREYLPPVDTPILSSFAQYWDRIAEQNPNLEIYNCGNAVIPSIERAELKDVIKG